MNYRQSKSFIEAFNILPMLKSLDDLYPDFQYWYVNKCMPGIVKGNDILLIAENKSGIQGVALGKKNDHETKLRCVRVIPESQNTGVGIGLVENMLESLGNEKPHCTVAEEMFHLYSRAFVNRFNFRLDKVEKGLYRRGKLEYIFNDEHLLP